MSADTARHQHSGVGADRAGETAPARIVAEALASGFVKLPVRSEAALRVAALPLHHRDPFDRLLVAQAITEPAMLYTADAVLANYSRFVLGI